MSSLIESIERAQLRTVPAFAPGDRVKVHFQVIEGTRRRTQVFEGIVIKRQGEGVRETFTVRKQSFGVGVERTFPVHSPKIEKIEIAARGDVRRAKLYYLRGRVGKRARVRERRGVEEEILTGPVGAVDAEGVGIEEAEPVEPVEPAEPEGGETGEAEAAAEATEPQPEAAEEPSGEAEGDDEPEADAGEPEPEPATAEPEAAGEPDDAEGESPDEAKD